MTADQLRAVTHQKPFRPFRVTLANGESFRIERPLRAAVAADRAVFGIDEDTQTGVARRMRMVPLGEIVGVEVLSVA